MLSTLSWIFLIPFIAIQLYILVNAIFSRDKTKIWSPMVVFSLASIYYIVLPPFDGLTLYKANLAEFQYVFYLAALVFCISILIGFNLPSPHAFKKWNNIFTERNIYWIGVSLFIVALFCYVPFRGFRYTISAEDSTRLTARTGVVSYLIDLISLFCASCSLLLFSIKITSINSVKKKLTFGLIWYLSLVVYIVGGFRLRIVWFLLTLLTTYHLGVVVKRPRYLVIICLAVISYLGFSIMDSARNYGAGIDLEKASELSMDEISDGAGENVDVSCFSISVLDYACNYDYRIGFEPLVTAALMPIPRSLFPWKPDGGYLKDLQLGVMGNSDEGAAFLIFVEAFISFGWIGVILYGLFVGWLSGLFWRNYKRNPSSIGAVVLLALYNGFCYDWYARGYMAGIFNNFMYYIIVPFWLSQLLIMLRKKT